MTPTRLPRRDYFLLPGLSLLTLCALLGCGEMAARHFFPDPEVDTCFTRSPKGPADLPNCVSFERVPESPRVQNRFDACGYRSLYGCGPKRRGTVRIAVLGSSVAAARLTPLQTSYMALAGDHFDFIPVASPLASPAHSYIQMEDVLALHPDAVIQIVSPIDIESLWMYVQGGGVTLGDPVQAVRTRRDWNHYLRATQDLLKNSRAVLAVEHFLFSDEDTYLRLYFLYGYKADFLRVPFSPAWRQRFAELDLVDGKIAQRLRQAGVPFYIAAAPSRADAVLLRSNHDAAFAWGNEVAGVAARHGAAYIDLLHAFAQHPDPGALFYTVDGHMNAAAQPILCRALVRALEHSPHPDSNR